MLKIYCPQCGSPTLYSINKPKFCMNCGNKFEITAKNNNTNEKPKIIEPNIIGDDDNDGPSVDFVPEISNLEVEISHAKIPTNTIKDIIGTAEYLKGSQDIIPTNNEGIINNKSFLESFKEEAGAIRPKSRTFKNNANKKD